MSKPHNLNSAIALPEKLEELYIGRNNGTPCLKDEAGKVFSGLIFKSSELISLAKTFDYEAHGYYALLSGPGMQERAPYAYYKNGKLGDIRQITIPKDRTPGVISDLDPDLRIYANRDWNSRFQTFGSIISKLHNEFEIRLKCLQFAKKDFHLDSHIIGIQPQGEDRESTICRHGEVGEILSKNGEFVMTSHGLIHSPPVSHEPRAGLCATIYDFQIS